MLGSTDVIAFAAIGDAERAKAFYRDVLGLRLIADEPPALVFDANGTMVRLQKMKQFMPVPYTVLGWKVADIAAMVKQLSERGVVFQRYPGLPQDDLGIWRSPSGAQVAWFQDPDGNTLSLTQFP